MRALSMAAANGTEYGLAASVWTNNLKAGLKLAHGLESGLVQINQNLVVQAIKAYFILETEGGNADVREEAFGMIKDSAVGLILVVISSSVLPTIVSIVLRTTGLIS